MLSEQRPERRLLARFRLERRAHELAEQLSELLELPVHGADDIGRHFRGRSLERQFQIEVVLHTEAQGDRAEVEFDAAEFDLVYAIGVLAEHSPFDASLAARVRRWLKPGGRFAFTTVDPTSFSVPRTVGRRLGQWLLRPASAAPAGLRRALRTRLMSGGLYADQERVRDVLTAVELSVESIEPFDSDVHRHVLAVARKPSETSAVTGPAA